MVQPFYRRHLQNTTNNVTGTQEDHDRSRKIGILNENVKKSAMSAFRRRLRVGVGIGKMMKKKMAGVNENCSICRDFENKKKIQIQICFKTNNFFFNYTPC